MKKNCTKLCKPHESNKAVWDIYQKYNNSNDREKEIYINELFKKSNETIRKIKHTEFI